MTQKIFSHATQTSFNLKNVNLKTLTKNATKIINEKDDREDMFRDVKQVFLVKKKNSFKAARFVVSEIDEEKNSVSQNLQTINAKIDDIIKRIQTLTLSMTAIVNQNDRHNHMQYQTSNQSLMTYDFNDYQTKYDRHFSREQFNEREERS